jgi:integrase
MLRKTHRSCPHCQRRMWQPNLKKHLERCKKKKVDQDGEGCQIQHADQEELKKKYQMLQIKYEMISKFLKDIQIKSDELVGSNLNIVPDEMIQRMSIAQTTKQLYQSDWRGYNNWSSENKMNPFLPKSANKYLESLKLAPSTKATKRSSLQSILQHLLERKVVLKKIRRRLHMITPKYSLSTSEIKEYLNEQKIENEEDCIAQLLMITYGLRINTIGGLKLQNLEFLKGTDAIYLPDTKSGGRRETVTTELKKMLTKLIKTKKIKREESFIFKATSNNVARRTSQIDIRINKRIKQSKVLKKKAGYAYSSHMFRKTKAFNAYTKALEEAKSEARKAIGHTEGSSSIVHYLN